MTSEPRRGPGVATGILPALALCALAPAAAQAAPPRITQPADVAGTAQVGATLEAQGGTWEGRPEPEASWQWLRCDGPAANDRSCRSIDGATKTSYTVAEADLGKRLRVLLLVRNEDGWAWSRSRPSDAVVPAPAPEPAPRPGPEPMPSPPPPTAPAPPTAEPAPAPQPVRTAPRAMRPRPVIRIRGVATPRGARITLLSVSAPRGARIRARCRGRGCPPRSTAAASRLTRLHRFERYLPAGVRLRITVTRPGYIGKVTTIRIRRGAAPVRTDRCLYPGRAKAMRCPG